MKVGVIGAGLMGSDIACLFSNAGNETVLMDVSEEALKKAISNFDEASSQLEEAGIAREEELIKNICYTTSHKFLEGSNFVVEAITEDLDAKRKLMGELEKTVSEDCIIASNSSTFTISEISKDMEHPERAVLMHFSNPPILRELAEVARGEKTSDETLEATLEIAEDIGKTPVVPDKECRGLILNRILTMGAVATSYLYADGVKPAEIDATFREFGSPHGIFEIMDLVGLDLLLKVQDSFCEVYGERFRMHEDFNKKLNEMVEENKLGKKTGEGFYQWEGREPLIPETDPEYDLRGYVAPAVNEGYRIIEDGVADKEKINKTYKLASGSPMGVFELLNLISLDEMKEKLDELYDKWEKPMFEPADALLEELKD